MFKTKLTALLISILFISGPLNAETPKTTVELFELFKNFEPSYEKIGNYSATLNKEELVRGKWVKETLIFHFQKPFKIKIEWLEGPKKGRRAFFEEGKNSNKIIIKLGGALGKMFPKVRIDPDGELAKDDADRTIRQAGLGYLMQEVFKVTQAGLNNQDLELTLLESEDPNVFKVERRLPLKPEIYPNVKLIAYIDKITGVLLGVEEYGLDEKLKGTYVYNNLKVNGPFTEENFKV